MRAASWMRTTSGAASPCASSPARTLCCRLSPPSAGGPKAAAARGRKEGERGIVARAVVGVDDDGRRTKRPRRGERFERMADQRLAGAGEVLLRRRRAEPRAAPGRHDDEGDAGRQAALTLQARPDADRPAAQG